MTIIGTLPPTVEKNAHYFETRECHIDAKGPLEIAATAAFGQGVRIITRSHEIHMDAGDDEEIIGDTVPRPVIVEHHAWICAGAILYNCRIGHHSIVAAGAVVRNCIVPPNVIVEGNPARIIKCWERRMGDFTESWHMAGGPLGPLDCPNDDWLMKKYVWEQDEALP